MSEPVSVFRGARALVGLSMQELASMSLCDRTTISRSETHGAASVAPRTLMVVRLALAAHGVEIAPDGKSIHLTKEAA